MGECVSRRIFSLGLMWMLVMICVSQAVAQEAPAPPAPAMPRLLEKPLLTLLPPDAPLMAGQDTSLRFQVLSVEGLPIEGVLMGATVDKGRILRIQEVKPGLHEAQLQVPPVTSPSLVGLQLRATVGGALVTRTFSLPVGVPMEGRLQLTVSSNTLKLGRTREVPFTIRGTHPDGRAIRLENTTLQASMGRVERLQMLPGGQISGVFVPEDRNIPHVAILAVFAGEGEQQLRAWTVLKMSASPEIPFSTEPGARVWVEIAGTTFGPVVAGRDGEARIPVEIHPGAKNMTVRVVDKAGNSSRSAQSLGIPRIPLSLLHMDRDRFRMDEQKPLNLTLLRVDELGNPVQEFPGQLKDTGGTLGGLVLEAPGVFTTTYLPPSVVGRSEVIWSIPLPEGGEERSSASVEVLEGAARRLEFQVIPERLRTDDPPAEVTLKVFDRLGNPATGVKASVEVPVGTVEAFRRISPGEFLTSFRPPSDLSALQPDSAGRYPVTLRVAVQRLPGEGPATALELENAPAAVLAGGQDVTLKVRARNRWDSPVAGVVVRASVEEGGGKIEARAETDARGTASFRYSPDAQVGPVVVHFWLDAQPQTVKRTQVLQTSRLAEEADRVLEATSVNKADADLTQEVQIELVAGRVRTVEVVAFPNVVYVNSRQASDITIRLKDPSGNLVDDPTLKLFASAGTVSPPRRSKKGTWYEAQYVPPPVVLPDARVRITATNDAGDFVGSTEVALMRADGRVLGTARVGVVSNFGQVLSPYLNFEAMLQLPAISPRVFLGGGIGYYVFDVSTVRIDILPIKVFATYRQSFGQLTPYFGVGPLAGMLVAQREFLGGDGMPTSKRSVSLRPGVGAKLGLEYAIGPGGIGLDLDLLVLNPGSIPALGLDISQNLGGISLGGGYVAHF